MHPLRGEPSGQSRAAFHQKIDESAMPAHGQALCRLKPPGEGDGHEKRPSPTPRPLAVSGP